jgi:DNA gyrase subunit A
MAEGEKIIQVNIEEEMKTAYIDYSMSVIVSRALPDVRDGFKPVHRRVLFGMLDLGVMSNRPYKKSARIVGEVLGKYHPHGDSSVYDTMVRMAQPWSLRYPLVDGQGNFGSIDGDSPAAMRYTEARLKKIAEEMLADIEKETVDFSLNFDDSLEEPVVLPSRVPNLIINGAAGIAVGMATNMAPHNLREAIAGTMAYIDNNDITIEELMQYITAPDFPTGGTIYGYEGVRQAYETGRGRVVMRAKTNFEELRSGKEAIIITEIPYMVNKAEMISRTADLINDKKIEGISDVRDESDRNGIRVVYELKRDAIPNVVLNNLFKHTALQSSFSINNVALVAGRPMTLNLKDLIVHFVDHRHEVVVRRAQFDLRKAEERAHILEGLIIASDNIDEVIKIIRAAKTPDEARENLISRFSLSEIQARAIVDMRLRQLTGLEQEKLRGEYDEVMATIKELKEILDNRDKRFEIIKQELKEISDKYGDDRRTNIEFSSGDLSIEDMIPNEKVVVTVSHLGYIKRTKLAEYKAQARGGVGSRGSVTRNEDFIEKVFVAETHNYLLVFTRNGKCFWMRVYEIPEGQKASKGRAVQNLLNIESDDKILAYINVENLKDETFVKEHFIVMCTEKGTIKKTSLEQYSRPRSNGIIAINVREGDMLLEARLTNGKSHIMMALESGRAIHFPEETVRAVGRNSMGVRGVTLAHDEDKVVGMISVQSEDDTVLVVSEKGYGKRSLVGDYRITNRGGKGVKTMQVTEKTGKVLAILDVSDENDIMIMNRSGITIRMSCADLRVMGRATQGVKLINLRNHDEIASLAKVDRDEDEEEKDLNIDGTNVEIDDAPDVQE